MTATAARATQSKPASGHRLHPTLLREYDIRGIVGETLFAVDAYAIGRAFAAFTIARSGKPNAEICVARDGRMSSPELEAALVEGIVSTGATALRVGVGPTPMLYFARAHLNADAGIMVTGSHNPPTHNGFKMVVGKAALYGDDIRSLGPIITEDRAPTATGASREVSVREDYLKALVGAFGSGGRPLTVAWDAGNGAAGEIMAELCQRLPGTHYPLFAEIDGTFPNHHPDPTVPKNLVDLIATVKAKGCDLGVAFDGDGDRLGVVDDEGEILWGDQLMVLYARDVLKERPGATIIADVKASQTLFDEIAKAGGTPLMWKTGHSLVKAKMAETGCPLAGEMSGHLFFADKYYGFDDGLYAAVRTLDIVARGNVKLSDIRKALPKTFSTPELRFTCAEDKKFQVAIDVKALLNAQGATYSDVDGVRVQTADGWWLLRASNTQAVLVARCEASSPEGLSRLQHDLEAALTACGVEMVADPSAH